MNQVKRSFSKKNRSTFEFTPISLNEGEATGAKSCFRHHSILIYPNVGVYQWQTERQFSHLKCEQKKNRKHSNGQSYNQIKLQHVFNNYYTMAISMGLKTSIDCMAHAFPTFIHKKKIQIRFRCEK